MHFMHPVLAVLAALAALAALGTLAAAPSGNELPNPYYITMLHKGVSWAELNESIGPLYIPDGQCSGVLDQVLQCGDGGAPRGVRVRVQDGALVRVALEPDLRRASVLRATCQGEAQVDVRLGCPR